MPLEFYGAARKGAVAALRHYMRWMALREAAVTNAGIGV